ncbi:hypothetical protein [Parapedobacter sp. SGR-10]|uniref:hypothetical protein n=1 Tax=Parapedobacter sp. SGR-10 TaxID=2710879 RepID=UPI00197FEDA2|nr:hypothetical protein [Parapedobacter sp. SGR-10]
MKGKVIVSKFWTRFFSVGKARAITIFPFIFLLEKSCKKETILLNHERIHIQQALELCILPFYLWYLVEFIYRFIRLQDFHQAYLHICFEREAYVHEKDFSYLRKRRYWSFLKYL